MVKKCSCIVCTICMMMAIGIRVKAAEPMGILQVIPTWCGQPVSGGRVAISRVGMIGEGRIILTDGLANWYVDESELGSEEWIGWLSQHTDEMEQQTSVCGENGAVFENLETGIYLVKQTESEENHIPFSSFFQRIPDNGCWNLTVCPKLIYSGEPPRTADYPAPIIGAMGIGLSAAILMVLSDKRKK